MDVIESQRVPDPMMSDAEYIHQRRKRPGDDTVGKVWAAVNVTTRIGGLAFIRRRQRHHERAAERFLNLYEARYGRVAPAIDLSKVRVDTSIIGHDGEMVSALDATHAIDGLAAELTKADFNRLVFVVGFGRPCSESPYIRGEPTGRALDNEVTALLGALDKAAELWGMMSRRVA